MFDEININNNKIVMNKFTNIESILNNTIDEFNELMKNLSECLLIDEQIYMHDKLNNNLNLLKEIKEKTPKN